MIIENVDEESEVESKHLITNSEDQVECEFVRETIVREKSL